MKSAAFLCRLTSTLLAITMSLSIAAFAAEANPQRDVLQTQVISAPDVIPQVCGDNANWDISDHVLTITGSGSISDYSAGESPWLADAEGITALVVEDGITALGSHAFDGLYNLAEASLPAGLLTIGDGAFANTALTSIAFPASVVSISDSAFDGCKALTAFRVAEGNAAYSTSSKGMLLSADGSTLYRCPEGFFSALFTYTVPSSVTCIGDNAFAGCLYLQTLYLRTYMTDIGSHAFRGCTNLSHIYLNNGLASIGDSAFAGCTALTQITIPESVTSIGSEAFAGSGLTDILFLGNAPELGSDVFSNLTLMASYASGRLWDVLPNGGGTVSWTEQDISYDLAQAAVVLSDSITKFDGAIHTASVQTLVCNGVTLSDDCYILSQPDDMISVGSYDITLTGQGSYFGTLSTNFEVVFPVPVLSSLERIDGGVRLVWQSVGVADATYNVYRIEDGVSTQLASGLTDYSYSDLRLDGTKRYTYTVTAVIDRVEGDSDPDGLTIEPLTEEPTVSSTDDVAVAS